MRRFLSLSLVCAMLAILAIAPARAQTKIGFVDVAQIMQKAPQAEAALKSLKQEFSTRDAKLAANRDAIAELEKKLETDGSIMSAENRSDLQRKITRQKREFTRSRDEYKEDFNFRYNEELGKVQEQVKQIIVELAESQDYDLIVTRRLMLYGSDRVEITDKVLARLKSASR